MFIWAAPPIHPGRLPRRCVLFLSLHCAFSPTSHRPLPRPGLCPLGSFGHTLYNLPTLQGPVQSPEPSGKLPQPPLGCSIALLNFPQHLGVSTLAVITFKRGFCLSLSPPPPIRLQPPCWGGLLSSRRVQPLAQCLVQRKCPVKIC